VSTWRQRWEAGAQIEVRTWVDGVERWTPARVVETPTRNPVTNKLRGRFRVAMLRPEGGEIEPGRACDCRGRS